MRQIKLSLALAALLPYYCYSESITPYYGQTGNAVTPEQKWVMENILPEAMGLDINAVLYNYTIQKPTDEQVDVTIHNENANGTGYIFREVDKWKPGSLSGTTIRKIVPVVPLNREFWGDGSIDVQGNGSVTDANVQYSYKVDPCYDPQSNPSCPGYEPYIPEIPEVDLDSIYSMIPEDGNEQYEEDSNYEDSEKEETEEEKEKREKEEEKDSKERLEKALGAADNSAMFAQALANSQMLDAMNLAQNMNSYYSATINGGTYNETISLTDKQLPENKSGLRNGLAQQILHNKMVDMQYKTK